MSTFEVKARRVTIEPHPNADKIELARVDGYVSIVQKGQFKSGDLAVYIPEQAVVPQWILEKLNLRLAGAEQNRVKAIRLRGTLSQGVLYPLEQHEESLSGWALTAPGRNNTEDFWHMHWNIQEDEDLADVLGITKYEPPIPVHMAGEVYSAPEYAFKYDFENIKNTPDLFEDGEEVVMTEKIHGTFVAIVITPNGVPYSEESFGTAMVTSKGLLSKGLFLKNNEQNAGNLYVRALEHFATSQAFASFWGAPFHFEPIYIFGEVFGKGVQDLDYGDKPRIRIFDVYTQTAGWAPNDVLKAAFEPEGLMVPILHEGKFDMGTLEQHTNGRETVSGKQAHIREGVVVRAPDRSKIAKSISPDYLLRGGAATEFN